MLPAGCRNPGLRLRPIAGSVRGSGCVLRLRTCELLRELGAGRGSWALRLGAFALYVYHMTGHWSGAKDGGSRYRAARDVSI